MFYLLFAVPILLAAVMLIARNEKLNGFCSVLYALILSVFSISLLFIKYNTGKYLMTDPLNIIFFIVLSFVYLSVTVYSLARQEKSAVVPKWHTYYNICLNFFAMSMAGAILSSHLGLLWVFMEATTLFSAPLIYFSKTEEALEAVWKYIFICSIGIALSFAGIILISVGEQGFNSLFFQDLYKNAVLIDKFWLKLGFIFVFIGFGTKIGLAPMHAWLPDAHSEAPSPVSALLSGTLLNSAMLGLLRVHKILKLSSADGFPDSVLVLAGFLSILISAVFIIKSVNYKRMLAYSSVENMGIIALGVGIGGIGTVAALLHVISHSFSKTSYFLTAGNILHIFHTKKSDNITGIIKIDRKTGWLWIFSCLAIVGMPPFPSFFSELLIAKAFLENHSIAKAILFLSLIAFIFYGLCGKTFRMSFGNKPEMTQAVKLAWINYLPQIALLTVLAIIGMTMPDILLNFIKKAAELL